MNDERPNVVLRGGELDGQQLRLGRGEEPRTYLAPHGQLYTATPDWEGTLLIYRIRRPRLPRQQR